MTIFAAQKSNRVNVKAISANVGRALLINALFMFFSIVVSIIYGFDEAFTPLAISFLITLVTGAFPFIFVKSTSQMTLQEGYITIVLAWLLSFIFGMLPYVLYGGEFTLINAWFESVSGYTTTGSTILTEIESLPKSILFWRSSTHFIGGLGVIIFLLILIPDANPIKHKLSNIELSSISKDRYQYRSGTIVKVMTSVYIGLAVTETLLLWAAGMTFYDAINHAFSTVATGGFSTKNISVMHYDSLAIYIIIMIYMTLAATHFGVIFSVVVSRSFKTLKHPVVKYYLTVIAVIAILITIILKSDSYGNWGECLLAGSFQTISYISTTGFGQADNALWPPLANALLLFAAFHCGCSGSTTGGIKADRMLISFKTLGNEIKRRLHPNSMFGTKVGGHILNENLISSVFLYIVLYLCILLLSMVLVLLCGVDLSEAFSGTLVSLGNVGPGTGVIGTMGNYATQPIAAKLIYTVDMFLGRVEIFPLLVVASMIFNRKRQ